MFRHYNVVTHRCPSCKTEVGRHVEQRIYVEPPIRQCPKCKAEVTVTTCNEWDLLSEREKTRYKGDLRTLIFASFQVFFVAASVSGFLVFFSGLNVRDRLPFFALEVLGFLHFLGDLFSAVVVGAGCGVLAVTIWVGYWIRRHHRIIRDSKRRMADPMYRERVVHLMQATRQPPS